MLKSKLYKMKTKFRGKSNLYSTVANYWTDYNVTKHHIFKTTEESLDYFHWRNDQYHGYIDLMPVSGQNDKVVLDYGCGPGHDLVGFCEFSQPEKIIGMDVSSASLNEARTRLALHNFNGELILLDPNEKKIPLADNSVDYIHSSGVLHHVPDLLSILKEFKRILRPGGKIRIMVYNYNSIWLHLWVAYLVQISQRKYTDLNIREAFSKTTDGENCPISHVYKPEEFIAEASKGGFSVDYLGAAISMMESSHFCHKRHEAILSRELSREHRKFLLELEVDTGGYPRYKGTYAGVDACFELTPL